MTGTLQQFKANVFQALSHPTRIAIVEQLRNGELSAGEIVERLGLEQSNASQHFAVLRAKNIVATRKEGCQVYYAMRDPLLIEVLDLLRRYFQVHIEEAISMFKEIDQTGRKDVATLVPPIRPKMPQNGTSHSSLEDEFHVSTGSP